MPSNRSAPRSDADVTSCLFGADSENPLTSDAPIAFTLDAGGNIRFVNDAGEQLCGYSQDELRRMNVAQIISLQSANYLRQQLRRNFRQRFGTVYEVEVVTKHGRRVMLEISIHLVRDNAHALEIHGIALQSKRGEQRFRPRCLDERFAFSL